MRNRMRTVGIVVLLGWPAAGWAAPSEWRLASRGFEESQVSAVAVAPQPPTLLYAASGAGVYVSRDGGQEWRISFRTPTQTQISDVAVDPAEPAHLLVATDHGVYGSWDDGLTWSSVLRGASEGQDEATFVMFHPQRSGTALVGTRGGLFVSRDGGRAWQPTSLPQEARAVRYGSFDPQEMERVWIVTEAGLFVGSLSDGQWQQRFGRVGTPEEAPIEPGQTDEASEPEQPLERLNAVARDPGSSAVYVATSRGAYVSLDTGATWQRLPQHGLPSSNVLRLVAIAGSPTVLYAGTANGVARYEPAAEQWQTITQGLASTGINDLDAGAASLWAATDQGLYHHEAATAEASSTTGPTMPVASAERLRAFAHEPTVGQVQEVAIRYAEVHPEKIALWRKQARLRALVPTFSTGFNNNVTDRWNWEGGSTTTAYDDHLLRGKDALEWNVNVSWDLGDMIWSADQTSIDVRSKLMVELRDDIVDEVTRTYFERRRVQMALLSQSPSDPEKRLEKELRVEELTALIDGLTGGWFSRELNQRGNAHGDTY